MRREMARSLREGMAAGGPTAGHPTDSYPRASFALMSVSTFPVMIGLSMLSPVLATLAEHRGLSPVQVGLLLGAYPLGRVVSAVPSGVLADRFTMSRAASIGCVLTISASIGAGVAPSFPVLLAMQLLQGVGSSIHTTAALAFVMAIVPPRRVGRLLATRQGIVLLGVSFSPVLGGVVVTYGGVNGPFWMYAVVVAAAWTLAVQAVARAGHRSRAGLPSPVPRPLPSRVVSPGTAGRALLRNRTFLVSLVIGFGLHWMVSGIRNTLVPLYAEELRAFMDGQIASFKIPRYFEFVDEWPMSATKIRKDVLRDRLVERLGLWVDMTTRTRNGRTVCASASA